MIEQLWQEHQNAPFPKGLRGEDVEGIDFVLLDADIAGCVITFLGNHGRLDFWPTAVLGLCYRNVSYVLPQLDEEGRVYFGRLETLAKLVLQAVAKHAAHGAV